MEYNISLTGYSTEKKHASIKCAGVYYIKSSRISEILFSIFP
jgi:hypothetical protein